MVRGNGTGSGSGNDGLGRRRSDHGMETNGMMINSGGRGNGDGVDVVHGDENNSGQGREKGRREGAGTTKRSLRKGMNLLEVDDTWQGRLNEDVNNKDKKKKMTILFSKHLGTNTKPNTIITTTGTKHMSRTMVLDSRREFRGGEENYSHANVGVQYASSKDGMNIGLGENRIRRDRGEQGRENDGRLSKGRNKLMEVGGKQVLGRSAWWENEARDSGGRGLNDKLKKPPRKGKQRDD